MTQLKIGAEPRQQNAILVNYGILYVIAIPPNQASRCRAAPVYPNQAGILYYESAPMQLIKP